MNPKGLQTAFRLLVVALVVSALKAAAQPTITTQPTNATVLTGSDVTFSITVSDPGPLSYQWQFNGTNLPKDTIITIAGNGTTALSGDGGPATNASLFVPHGIALDSAGNLYIADYSHDRIRKVDTNGIISTVAGGGTGADGDLATNASLSYPVSLAVDNAGNVFVADTYHSRIRKVDANGIITTIAGTGTNGYGGDSGLATNVNLYRPQGVALDGLGNLYISDSGANHIRQVDTNGVITTVAGFGVAGFSGDGEPATNAFINTPSGLAFEFSGNLYIADTGNNRIRKVNAAGIITTVAGTGTAGFAGDNGAAKSAKLNGPTALAVDPLGNLYIADSSNYRVRVVDTNGIIRTVAGNGGGPFSGDDGSATNASLGFPHGVALDPCGNLLVAGYDRIRKVFFTGLPTLSLHNLTQSSTGDYRVIVTSPSGSVTSLVATLTVGDPPALRAQPTNQILWAGSTATFAVSATGSPPLDYRWYFNGNPALPGGDSSVLTLSNVAAGDVGSCFVVVTNLYGAVTSQTATLVVNGLLAQPTNQFVLTGTRASLGVTMVGPGPFRYQWRLNGTNLPNNLISTVAGTGLSGRTVNGAPATNTAFTIPYGVTLDASGSFYISDNFWNQVHKVNTNGILTIVAGNGTGAFTGDGAQATNASLNSPSIVAVDPLGNLYIPDQLNHRIRKVGTNGIITTVAGKGAASFAGDGGPAVNACLCYPYAVALDSLGNLFIADNYNNRIRKVGTNGIITTVAGNGTGAYAGDGGRATNASLYRPTGVAVDSVGNLFIADNYNHRIRKVDPNGIISTVAGNGYGAGFSGDGGAATNARLYSPLSVSVDGFGNVFFSDCYNHRVRMVNTDGIISTVAGNGQTQNAGDGNAATNATLYYPSGVATDVSGNLHIADRSHYRVRYVPLGGYPTLTLNNVTTNRSGDYSVVITTPAGSITSSVATLTVELPPAISGILPQPDGTVRLDFTGTPNISYRLWVATNLVPPVLWSPLSTNTAGTDGTWHFTDTNASSYPTRLYRASIP